MCTRPSPRTAAGDALAGARHEQHRHLGNLPILDASAWSCAPATAWITLVREASHRSRPFDSVPMPPSATSCAGAVRLSWHLTMGGAEPLYGEVLQLTMLTAATAKSINRTSGGEIVRSFELVSTR